MREQIRELLNTFLDDYDKGDPTVDWVFILVHRLASAGVVLKVQNKDDFENPCGCCESYDWDNDKCNSSVYCSNYDMFEIKADYVSAVSLIGEE